MQNWYWYKHVCYFKTFYKFGLIYLIFILYCLTQIDPCNFWWTNTTKPNTCIHKTQAHACGYCTMVVHIVCTSVLVCGQITTDRQMWHLERFYCVGFFLTNQRLSEHQYLEFVTPFCHISCMAKWQEIQTLKLEIWPDKPLACLA